MHRCIALTVTSVRYNVRVFALPDPADYPLQNGSSQLAITSLGALMLLGKSGEEGDGSASEGLRNNVVPTQCSAELLVVRWHGGQPKQTLSQSPMKPGL